jgi:hypothetical protein
VTIDIYPMDGGRLTLPIGFSGPRSRGTELFAELELQSSLGKLNEHMRGFAKSGPSLTGSPQRRRSDLAELVARSLEVRAFLFASLNFLSGILRAMAKILYGKPVREMVEEMKARWRASVSPCLAILQVGEREVDCHISKNKVSKLG